MRVWRPFPWVQMHSMVPHVFPALEVSVLLLLQLSLELCCCLFIVLDVIWMMSLECVHNV